jgi:hypothetical protein
MGQVEWVFQLTGLSISFYLKYLLFTYQKEDDLGAASGYSGTIAVEISERI